MKYLEQILNKDNASALYTSVTVGQVVDANDPQEMGRLRILCPALGDSANMLMEDIPWATYLSPFGGTTSVGSRGRNDEDYTQGPVAYGMWAIPKVGATAMVICIDGDPRFRVWMGCIHGQFLPHTLPHGRFASHQEFGEGDPAGPVSSEEEPIEPSSSQLELAFTQSQDTVGAVPPATPKTNHEYNTRGADHAVASVTADIINSPFSSVSFTADEEDQGYKKTRIDPNSTSEFTGDVKDSQVYSWTTPGFHSIAMDDSADNCRIRLRTTHGNQILLDDTNERIYISTPQGDSWIEMDEKGNIDIYAKRNISYHAEEDFNVTAKNIRMKATDGIHMVSESEVRIHSKASDLHLISNSNIRIQSGVDTEILTGDELLVQATTNIDMKATVDCIFEAGTDMNMLGGNATNVEAAGGNANINAGGQVIVSGTQIHLNGPSADSAAPGTGVDGATHKEAFWTNRIPEHEPWPRVMTQEKGATATDNDGAHIDFSNTHFNAAEYSYDDPLIGKMERGFDLTRNKKWRR